MLEAALICAVVVGCPVMGNADVCSHSRLLPPPPPRLHSVARLPCQNARNPEPPPPSPPAGRPAPAASTAQSANVRQRELRLGCWRLWLFGPVRPSAVLSSHAPRPAPCALAWELPRTPVRHCRPPARPLAAPRPPGLGRPRTRLCSITATSCRVRRAAPATRHPPSPPCSCLPPGGLTSRPAILPASLVAWRWESLK